MKRWTCRASSAAPLRKDRQFHLFVSFFELKCPCTSLGPFMACHTTLRHPEERGNPNSLGRPLVNVPMLYPANGYWNDITHVDGESIDNSRLLKTLAGIEEGQFNVPTIRVRAADRTAIDADGIELHFRASIARLNTISS